MTLKPDNLVHILDIMNRFDEKGYLISDLYCRETDSRGHLCYSTCNHEFSGMVYSPAMQLKCAIRRAREFTP